MKYRGFVLDRFQTEAIEHLQKGHSVLVAAPTGTGKTIIADWMVDQALAQGKEVIYTAPIKALSNQKFRDYCKLHGEENVGLVTGDLVIRREAPIRVMTTEILRNMLLAGESFHDLMAVVIDEVHFLDDRDRGTVWEEVLIYLPPRVKVVALSATLPNLKQFARWLSNVREHHVQVITETKRTVPLEFRFAVEDQGLITPEEFEKAAKRAGRTGPVNDKRRGSPRGRQRGAKGAARRGRKDRDFTPLHPIDVFKMIRRERWLPLLYFVFSRQDTERYARQLAFRYRAELLNEEELAQMEDRLKVARAEIGPALDERLVDMYKKGIAFHHAGLHVGLKALVEELYERKLIKALYTTSTFALGINMPARTVAFHGLMKFDGQAVRPLSTRGFMQKAGRAGRRGLDEFGHVVIRLHPSEFAEFKPILKKYERQDYEPVRSSFSLSWNSIVNLLERHDLEHVRTIVNKSFLNFHLAESARRQLAKAEALEVATDDRVPTKRELKEARRLRRRAEQAEDLCFNEFLRKRDFLKSIGYLAEDDSFNAGAKLLRHLQISEIFAVELLLSGVLEGLDDDTLFGLLCAMTTNLPRSVQRNYSLKRQDRALIKEIERIRWSEPVTRAEEVTRQPYTWSPDLLPIGRLWAEGGQLMDAMMMLRSHTDVSGSLVSGFRRAKDLTTQLRQAYLTSDPDRADQLHELARKVSRDEVEVVD